MSLQIVPSLPGRDVLGHAPSPFLCDVLTTGALLPHWQKALEPGQLATLRASSKTGRTCGNWLQDRVNICLFTEEGTDDDELDELDLVKKAVFLDELPNLELLAISGSATEVAVDDDNMVDQHHQDHIQLQLLNTVMRHLRPATLTRIKVLHLDNAVLAQSMMHKVALMQHLEAITLSGRIAAGDAVDTAVLAACGSLRRVVLHSVQGVEALLPGLQAIASLRCLLLVLHTDASSASVIDCSSLTALVQLAGLCITSSCQPQLNHATALTALNALEVLSLPNTDGTSAVLAAPSTLNSLTLGTLTCKAVQHIEQAGLPLQHLSVSNVHLGNDQQIPKLPATMLELIIRGTCQEEDWTFLERSLAAGSLPALISLQLQRIDYFRAAIWQGMAARNAIIHTANIGFCSQSIAHLCLNERKELILKLPTIESCQEVSVEGFGQLYTYLLSGICRQIKRFTRLLFYNCNFTGVDLYALSDLLHANGKDHPLESLTIVRCYMPDYVAKAVRDLAALAKVKEVHKYS